MPLKFKTYDDYMRNPYFHDEENIINDVKEYVAHKVEGGKEYFYDGYPGVTSVESIMTPEKKPILEKWRAKLRAQGKDPVYVSKQYADIGTLVHYDIECKICSTFIKPPEWDISEYPDHASEYIGNARYMWNQLTTGAKPAITIENASCECFSRNDKLRYSGYYDLYAVINGKRTIADFKTSPACKDEYLMQLGAYALYFNDLPEQGIIFNICVDDRNPSLRPIVTILNQEQLNQAIVGWTDMITAFHDIYDPYIPIVKDKKWEAPVRVGTDEENKEGKVSGKVD